MLILDGDLPNAKFLQVDAEARTSVALYASGFQLRAWVGILKERMGTSTREGGDLLRCKGYAPRRAFVGHTTRLMLVLIVACERDESQLTSVWPGYPVGRRPRLPNKIAA